MKSLIITNNLDNKSGETSERIDFNDLYASFKINWQLNTSYQISFTATYTDQYKDAYNLLKMKRYLYCGDQFYAIQQVEEGLDENGLPTLQVTANAALIDMMKNIRVDPAQPTENNPDISGSDSGSSSDDDNKPQSGTVVKRTDEQQTYTLQDRLDQFMKHNDQGIKYELHGNFPQAAVDCSGSLYEWLGQNLATFGAYYVPDNYVLKIYDLENLRHPTDRVFRYLNNVSSVNIQSDGNDLYNDFDVYGGKMEKDIIGGGGAGSLENVEAFLKSPINADFGVNKAQMLANFASRDDRVRSWGVDVNRLYDTIKAQGVSPEWFFAYDLIEGGHGWGWLNHTYRHGDAYQDAISVCNWIKQWANSDSFTPAWGAAEGSISADAGLTAKWNQEFGKGTIGRCYLQGTAAAVWELAGRSGNSSMGKPVAFCINTIKEWGGHSNAAGGGAAKWIAVAKSFVGIPYVWRGGHSGNNPRAGMDCSGLGEQIAKACGFDIGGGNTVSLEQASTPISRDQVQTGDMGFYGTPGSSYHVVWALDNQTYVAEPDVGKTCYIGQINSYPASFWKRHPKIAQFIGSGSSAGSGSSGDTSETYYALYYHYHNQESIDKYGLHRGPQITMDSIYDMKALQQYVDNTVQHDPTTSLTNNEYGESDFQLGDTAKLIIPERDIDTTMTLMGFEYNPYNPDDVATLTWNNTGLAMKNEIYALYQDIHQINRNVDSLNAFGGTGGREDDQFTNPGNNTVVNNQPTDHNIVTLDGADMQRLKAFTEGEN